MWTLDALLAAHGWPVLIFALAAMSAAGFSKGVVGFALPMISVSLIGSVMPAQMAVAAMILPGIVTNVWQTLRQGLGAAGRTLREYWRLNAVLFVMIALCAQLVTILSDRTLFLILGVGVTVFGVLQISGYGLPPTPRSRRGVVEPIVGIVSGFFGGLAGVWGPPIVLYLASLGVDKQAMVRAQGVSYLIGSMILTGAHLRSGLLLGEGGTLSALMIVPAVAGMALGLAVQDRLDPLVFRKVTLAVLILAGLNLLRRGLMG
ncbi:MAG: sulfite exporter TauE/SafE family protein [Pseudomonadota bacterium]